MSEEQLEKILKTLVGLRFHEWKSIENAVNMEFSAMFNRLELIDVSRIPEVVFGDMEENELPPIITAE